MLTQKTFNQTKTQPHKKSYPEALTSFLEFNRKIQEQALRKKKQREDQAKLNQQNLRKQQQLRRKEQQEENHRRRGIEQLQREREEKNKRQKEERKTTIRLIASCVLILVWACFLVFNFNGLIGLFTGKQQEIDAGTSEFYSIRYNQQGIGEPPSINYDTKVTWHDHRMINIMKIKAPWKEEDSAWQEFIENEKKKLGSQFDSRKYTRGISQQGKQ